MISIKDIPVFKALLGKAYDPTLIELDSLNDVDTKLEKYVDGHGHRGLNGDDNQVVKRNPQ